MAPNSRITSNIGIILSGASKIAPHKTLILLLLFCVKVTPLHAAPWIDPSDERTRHHLQSLTDSGIINTPITTWPVMWSSIKTALNIIDPTDLSADQLWSYQYLKHELRRQNQKIRFTKQLYISNTDTAITYFGTDSREEIQGQISLSYMGDRTAFRLSSEYAHEPFDKQSTRLDGSYFTYLLGNWAIGAGSIDRWWGPGWESSMILGNNARPLPGLFLQRNQATAFATPVLRWLGPWQLTTFMSQLESKRDHAHARLWGMRANFRPLPSLEIGLSRTAMWAGDGRPGDTDTFFNLLLGRDNRGDAGTDINNEPGNQLAGFDARWGVRLGSLSSALYAQLIGEDEANGTPSRHIGMAGIEFQGSDWDMHWRFNLEALNSHVYFYDSEEQKVSRNSAYEHSIYYSGYRYRGRVLGASTDNDTESISLRGQAYLRNGHHINARIAKHNINYDHTHKVGSTNGFNPDGVKTIELELSYTLPLSDHYAVKIGGFHFSDDISYHNKTINTGGFIQLDGRW